MDTYKQVRISISPLHVGNRPIGQETEGEEEGGRRRGELREEEEEGRSTLLSLSPPRMKTDGRMDGQTKFLHESREKISLRSVLIEAIYTQVNLLKINAAYTYVAIPFSMRVKSKSISLMSWCPILCMLHQAY